VQLEVALDRRLDVELLQHHRLRADQQARAAWQLLLGGLARLEEVERAPALADRVGDPDLEAEARDVLELVDRLVAQVAAQLLDRRLRVVQAPEDDAADQNGPRGS
jgi:hypothetical protein